jgi:hypothetical protein
MIFLILPVWEKKSGPPPMLINLLFRGVEGYVPDVDHHRFLPQRHWGSGGGVRRAAASCPTRSGPLQSQIAAPSSPLTLYEPLATALVEDEAAGCSTASSSATLTIASLALNPHRHRERGRSGMVDHNR